MSIDSGDDNSEASYCCAMRRFAIVGLVAVRGDAPAEAADFVSQWEPKITFRARFCCWCGRLIPPEAPVTTVGMSDD